jgi:transaldolase
MSNERLRQLADAGVSIWLDDLSRERLNSGNLQELITDKHVVGVTTNPSIFQAAISKSSLYDDDLVHLRDRRVEAYRVAGAMPGLKGVPITRPLERLRLSL